ncbi:hypothetical protein LJR289_000833 [Pseudoduganella sp. LjRoot289]|uniref:hypothetical protein n=1 Tax=Pseudoduganella sp. LjRoot289 TaxID=3342314 RepID=UPI003ECD8823
MQEEKVGIARIRIHQERARSTAVLGSFVSADKLLRSWAAGPQDYFECDFEIEYLDGYRICGRYPMWQKCTTRQSLGAYVRRTLDQLAVPGKFLERYEVEDFAERDARRSP